MSIADRICLVNTAEDGENFVNLHFGLEVFPDENSGVFVITCGVEGKYCTMSLKYDPLGEKRRKEVRLARGSRNVLRIDDVTLNLLLQTLKLL